MARMRRDRSKSINLYCFASTWPYITGTREVHR